MRSFRDQYIHELSVEKIKRILATDAWSVANQSITSAVTNDNDLKEPNADLMQEGENTAGINAFSDITFDASVKRILDVGGGRFDCNREYMKRKKKIDLFVWDPYNRPLSHNRQIQQEIQHRQIDAATSMSVLNVIPEIKARLMHIHVLKSALPLNAKAYFKIWSGEQPFQGSYLPCGSDDYYQANAYADRFLREIEVVFGMGNVKLDDKIPNLIVAVKTTASHADHADILLIQKKSVGEMGKFTQMKKAAIRQIYEKAFYSHLKSFSLFVNVQHTYLESNRHVDARHQLAYDKRYGLLSVRRTGK